MTDDACRRGKRPGAGPPDGGVHAGPGGQSPVLEQEFGDGSLYALRAAVAAHASRAGLSEGRTGDLVLVVHELAANAIRHGAGHGRLRLWTAAGAVRCEITDDGPAGAAAPDAAQWPAGPGHGLWLARQVADQASVDSGPSGTVAAVSFALRPPGDPAPPGLARRFQDGCVIVTVTGQLDLGSSGRLTRAVGGLARATPGLRLVLDLSGLAALITAQRQIDAVPAARMVLAGLPARLARQLHDAGHAGRFTVADTTAGAIRIASSA
jgi:anti-sigma regulatory factor (Ser/Thr protein kinase)/anti-anti-sigma regulatory factor